MNKKEIAKQILESNDFEPMDIQISDKHMPYVKKVAEELDLTINETASFLLYSYINDMILAAKIETERIMPRN
jgi:hypothetical protein